MEQEITDERARALIDELKPLLGVWLGNGTGRFPTIETFAFHEELTFQMDSEKPVIRYEQRTWLDDANGEPAESSHSEVGFIRPTDDGELEVANVQASGRVEVLRGEAVPGVPDGELSLVFESVILENDDRMKATRRRFDLVGGALRYSIDMATQEAPELQAHIQSALQRR